MQIVYIYLLPRIFACKSKSPTMSETWRQAICDTIQIWTHTYIHSCKKLTTQRIHKSIVIKSSLTADLVKNLGNWINSVLSKKQGCF